MFPHVIASLGEYLSREAGLSPGEPMAYLVAPPIEATIALDAALKAADVRAVHIIPPPTETNFAAAWLTGTLDACEAAAPRMPPRSSRSPPTRVCNIAAPILR